MIITIAGKAGHGKDTVAAMIAAKHAEIKQERNGEFEYEPFRIVHWATRLKQVCATLTGLPLKDFLSRETKSNKIPWLKTTVRELLQKVGEGLRKEVHPEIWINSTLRELRRDGNYIIADSRYKLELESVRKVKGIIIKVVRPGYIDDSIKTKEQEEHPSETEMLEWDDWDYVITNDRNMVHLDKLVHNIVLEICNKEDNSLLEK